MMRVAAVFDISSVAAYMSRLLFGFHPRMR